MNKLTIKAQSLRDLKAYVKMVVDHADGQALTPDIREELGRGLRCLWAHQHQVVFLGLKDHHNKGDFDEALVVAPGQQRSQWGFVKVVASDDRKWFIVAPENTLHQVLFEEQVSEIVKTMKRLIKPKLTLAFKNKDRSPNGVPDMKFARLDAQGLMIVE
jgi:hypothetical protein